MFLYMSPFGPTGETGELTSLGLESTTEATTASQAATFFEGTRYTDKVLREMEQDDFHGFPESVEGFAEEGKVRTFTGGDGQLYKALEIPGGYKNADQGVFQFFKDAQGVINHRYFKPLP